MLDPYLATGLEFTPLEFETSKQTFEVQARVLEFTPLEFETYHTSRNRPSKRVLEFTPLEFETPKFARCNNLQRRIRIYSVGV